MFTASANDESLPSAKISRTCFRPSGSRLQIPCPTLDRLSSRVSNFALSGRNISENLTISIDKHLDEFSLSLVWFDWIRGFRGMSQILDEPKPFGRDRGI
jgi:hypothetical protein